MKVGLVCPYDWSHPGGVRTHVAGLAGALAARGAEVRIAAPASRPEPGIVVLGRPVPVPANGSVARICFSPGASRRIGALLADLDVVHLHEPLIPSVSLLALMDGRVPSVATFHASAGRSLGYAAARPVLARLAARLGARIAVSEAARALAARYFPEEYALIPNGIDLARFAGAVPDPDAAALRPFVLFVGRPEPRKGLPVVLRAMRELRGRRDVRLVVAGARGPFAQEWVTALGPVPHERLPGLYAAADAFCAPSLGGESFGYILIEAMAAGCPVVASDLPGYREASGGAARLVAPDDPEALAAALDEVLADRALGTSLAESGRRRAAELDWAVIVDRVMDCYRSAQAGRVS